MDNNRLKFGAAAASLFQVERYLRRVRGCESMRVLVAAIDKHTTHKAVYRIHEVGEPPSQSFIAMAISTEAGATPSNS
jgi:hypothetical protein